jgi:hypothetical protein
VVQEGDDMQDWSGVLQQGVVEEWSVAARGSGGAEWSVAEEVSLPYLPDYHTQLF